MIRDALGQGETVEFRIPNRWIHHEASLGDDTVVTPSSHTTLTSTCNERLASVKCSSRRMEIQARTIIRRSSLRINVHIYGSKFSSPSWNSSTVTVSWISVVARDREIYDHISNTSVDIDEHPKASFRGSLCSRGLTRIRSISFSLISTSSS